MLAFPINFRDVPDPELSRIVPTIQPDQVVVIMAHQKEGYRPIGAIHVRVAMIILMGRRKCAPIFTQKLATNIFTQKMTM